MRVRRLLSVVSVTTTKRLHQCTYIESKHNTQPPWPCKRAVLKHGRRRSSTSSASSCVYGTSPLICGPANAAIESAVCVNWFGSLRANQEEKLLHRYLTALNLFVISEHSGVISTVYRYLGAVRSSKTETLTSHTTVTRWRNALSLRREAVPPTR